jgi:hypothetical protein
MNRLPTIGVHCVEWLKNSRAINQRIAASAIHSAAAS